MSFFPVRILALSAMCAVLGRAQSPETAPKPAATESAEVQAIIEQARAKVRGNDFASAHRILDQAIPQHPSQSILRKKRAQVLLLLNAFEPAMSDMDHYSADGAADGEFWHLRGHALRNLMRPVAALRAYEESKRLGYESADLDQQLVAMQKVVDAKKASLMTKLEVATAERSSEYWWERINLELELGLLNEAREHLGEWERRVPGEPAVRYATAYVLMETKDWSGAKKCLEELGLKGTATARAWGMDLRDRTLADLYARKGDWAEVLKYTSIILEKEPEQRPGDPRMLRFRALALLCLGKYDEYRAWVSLATEAQQKK